MSASYVLKHNPTTITTPVYGVVGPSGTAWKIVNLSSVRPDRTKPLKLEYGILLNSGGTVINGGTGTKSASISGSSASAGVEIRSAAGTVTNFGAITGAVGIELQRGGTVTNALSASITRVDISGAAGRVTNFGVIADIQASDTPSTVTNHGRITGSIALYDGGIITNATSKALISGGINISRGATGTVTNFGTIENGVALYDGGALTNGGIHNISALISGYGGVRVAFGGNPTKLTNFGTITGVSLSGGTVTNGSAGTRSALIASKTDDGVFVGGTTAAVTNFGTIAGRRGVALEPTGASTVRNFGTISGHGNDGVFFGSGSVLNGADAVISGTGTSVDIGVGTVTNLGRIAAAGDGIRSGGGGLVTNGGPGAADATIAGGGTGVVMYGAHATLKNFGTISGAGGTAARLDVEYGRVIVEAGAKFLGAAGKPGLVLGNNNGTLELAAKSSGALLLGTQFVGFSAVIVDSGADWRVDVGLTSLSGETIAGNGSNVLAFTGAGTFDLSGVRGFPTISLTNLGPNALTLADASFTGVAGGVITVNGGNGDDTIAADLAAKHHVVLRGGAGADIFKLSPTTLATAKVEGGSGSDTLAPSAAGKLLVGGVSGVETYVLANGGPNSLTLADGNFIGVTGGMITVDGGNAGNTLGEAGVSAADKAVLNGGAGADTLIAGRNAMLKGGAGEDVFELTVAGSAATPDTNTIADFTHGVDKLALSEKGFGLGAAPVAATLFTSNAKGSFTTAAQRFAYDTTNGDLFFDSRGNAGASPLEIATLTNRPTLTAGDITFLA